MRTLIITLAYAGILAACAGLAIRDLATDSYPAECPNGEPRTTWCGCDAPIIPPSDDGTDPGDC